MNDLVELLRLLLESAFSLGYLGKDGSLLFVCLAKLTRELLDLLVMRLKQALERGDTLLHFFVHLS